MNIITINGKTHYVSGNNISVVNGKIKVDGRVLEEGLKGEVTIKFEGDLASLSATEVKVNGSVHGDVDCTSLKVEGDIGGETRCTSLDIQGDIKGNVDATSIKIRGKIIGDVKATSVYNKLL